jgi:hypothetical protein
MSVQLPITDFFTEMPSAPAIIRRIRKPSLTTFKGALPRASVPSWKFDKAQRVESDFTQYFQSNMGVCLELEYNPRHGGPCSRSWRNEIDNERNMIWDIDADTTLQTGGEEFVIKADPMPSEEFAQRLPLQVFRDHFRTGPNASTHSHAILLPYAEHKPVPIQIAKNAWQLFRTFYPGWVYLFGNHKGKMLRSSWAVWESSQYKTSAFASGWEDVCVHNKRGKSGLSFSDCTNGHMDYDHQIPLDNPIHRLNAEIRTSDSTQELDQIIALRALTKALFVRAADLANMGVIELPDKRRMLAEAIAADIERSVTIHYSCGGGEAYEATDKPKTDFSLEARVSQLCGRIAVAFYNEVKPYLSTFEKRCVKSCIIRPVRQRGVILES